MLLLRHTLLALLFSLTAVVQGQNMEVLLEQVDSVVTNAIRQEAFPGCVIYASKSDSIFFLRSYGYHTYDSNRRVAVNDIYDLASITKIVGGTLAIMKLYEDGYIRLDERIGSHIEDLGKNIGHVTFREAMAHQGGIYPWIPYHSEVRKKNGSFKKNTVATEQNGNFPFSITDSLYLHKDFYAKIKKMIRKRRLSEKKYRYSGLFFYLIPELVQNLTDTTYQDYLQAHFYDPLGIPSLGFNPKDRFELNQIVPTEIDTFFRMTPIHGKVHDEGAIMMEGVSANAGLFSNAADLGVVFNMLSKNGMKDTVRLLAPQTVRLFTTAQYPNNDNRRGLGFDKPLLKYDSVRSSVAKDASFESYGHTGYTGPLAWTDPENKLTFIFLTNRVYPSRNNRALYQLSVRPTIHQLFYDYLNDE